MAVLPRHIEAATAAAQSTTGIKRYKLGACLFNSKGHILLSKGNQRKTHPALKRLTDFPFIHAESGVILGHGLDNCKELSILVVRMSSDGVLTMAKPCYVCVSLAEYAGIKDIYYTNWEGAIEQFKI